MHKLHSTNLNEENIDDVIKKEKIISEKLKKYNEEIKEKNLVIQERLLSYIEENNFIYERNSNEDIEKYNKILTSIINYMNTLNSVEKHMQKETCNLMDEFFHYNTHTAYYSFSSEKLPLLSCFSPFESYLVKEDMNYFKVFGKDELFRRILLTLRKVYEHNSILRAQISLYNKFKLKDENLIHADFEQLELKYRNLKSKEALLKKKNENLNGKICKATEVQTEALASGDHLKPLCSRHAVVTQSSRSRHAVVTQSSRSRHAVVTQSLRSRYTVVTQSLRSRYAVKKLHYDEKSLYLEKVLEEKMAELNESYDALKSKKSLLGELKKKKDESFKRCNEAEIGVITKNVFEEFHEQKQHLQELEATVITRLPPQGFPQVHMCMRMYESGKTKEGTRTISQRGYETIGRC
ncbi:hypothetical protein, conserved [Plasmodium ovale wallikeri]|uniref:Uncharacterized protein n=1 Tax=Plasmodium ovale wallikeri TaxID=864142 RepID=A0A1A8YKI3_PLAOA|nr:hypothetical protein, conserved [Plasmodium ovale wallikeri]